MRHSLQIMLILPLFWKSIVLGGLYRGVPLYFILNQAKYSLTCINNLLQTPVQVIHNVYCLVWYQMKNEILSL